MQQCNDLHIFNQASRRVLTILLRQCEQTNEQIELSRIDKVLRWRLGIADEGLTVKSSASLVGEPVANLYRWEKDPMVYSKRPKTVRQSKWTPELVQAVKEVREENPTWGKLKIHARFKERNFDVSVSFRTL